jgi:hypothetical protein
MSVMQMLIEPARLGDHDEVLRLLDEYHLPIAGLAEHSGHW